ncbi:MULTISPECIES: tripartite tricarboxylate transporter TctB family protein [unclassified Achromobacter]|uniref:tripartite tricarboxylate transporter TctB family protein n=1 Tax=unclassified Achromobacter TaxID=2626865 RepID=UPI000B51E037|nr:MULTISPECIES: tripartite tricarboxylate transporter TctB family protein [unclassified Achromobacter]OWT75734.1 hypothetical protein CEY04_19515 [Achromobacter sp. HZ28]OWT76394.1 hypothetical protein CEY05_14965 [Achromobacter sp. HZ34]
MLSNNTNPRGTTDAEPHSGTTDGAQGLLTMPGASSEPEAPSTPVMHTMRTFSIGGQRYGVDLAHLGFVTAIVAWCAWYGVDAWRAQKTITNLILIVPAVVGALVLYVVIALKCFKRVPPQSVPARGFTLATGRNPLKPGMASRIAVTMAMLLAFVIVGPTLGFDIACFAYIAAMLLFTGERRLWVLLGVPLLFCALVLYCFTQLLYTPLPLMFFRGNS